MVKEAKKGDLVRHKSGCVGIFQDFSAALGEKNEFIIAVIPTVDVTDESGKCWFDYWAHWPACECEVVSSVSSDKTTSTTIETVAQRILDKERELKAHHAFNPDSHGDVAYAFGRSNGVELMAEAAIEVVKNNGK